MKQIKFEIIMKIFEYRITKVEKGAFFIEYKTCRFGSWKEVDKKFKTKPKADDWVRKNFMIEA